MSIKERKVCIGFYFTILPLFLQMHHIKWQKLLKNIGNYFKFRLRYLAFVKIHYLNTLAIILFLQLFFFDGFCFVAMREKNGEG